MRLEIADWNGRVGFHLLPVRQLVLSTHISLTVEPLSARDPPVAAQVEYLAVRTEGWSELLVTPSTLPQPALGESTCSEVGLEFSSPPHSHTQPSLTSSQTASLPDQPPHTPRPRRDDGTFPGRGLKQEADAMTSVRVLASCGAVDVLLLGGHIVHQDQGGQKKGTKHGRADKATDWVENLAN